MTAHCHIARVAGLAALCAASLGQTQTIPQSTDFGSRLPSIPLTSAPSVAELGLQAIPGLGGHGIEIAPGVIVDRLVRPRCVFIANDNPTGGAARQTAIIGQVQLYCP